LSGIDEFKETLKNFREIAIWATATSGILPVVTSLSGISPIWPEQSEVLTSIMMFVMILLSFQFLRKSSKKKIDRFLLLGAGFLFLGILSYLLVSVIFIPNIDEIGNKVFVGCGWTNHAIQVAKEYGADPLSGCPGQFSLMLKAAEFDSSVLYNQTSLNLIKFGVFLLWLIGLLGFSTCLSTFVIFQSRK